MTNQDRQSAAFPRGKSVVHPRRRGSLTAARRGERWGDGRYLAAYRRLLARHQRLIRRVGIGSAVVIGVVVLGCAGLWWRLSAGPIQLDAFSPWLISAIEENFGSLTARRNRRNPDRAHRKRRRRGAGARYRGARSRRHGGRERAEGGIRLSGMSLLSGHMRAESLNLVGAGLAVRIEQDGRVTVFASGADKRPIATASMPIAAAAARQRPRTEAG